MKKVLILFVLFLGIVSITNANAYDKGTVDNFNQVLKYSIENERIKKRVQLDDNIFNNKSEGRILELHKKDINSNQAWEFKKLSDGSYIIRSIMTKYVISVPSGKEDKKNTALIQENYHGFDRQKWFIKSIGNDKVIIVPKSNSSMCLAVGASIMQSNGVNIEQRKQSDVSWHKEWKIFELTNVGTIGITNFDHNHTATGFSVSDLLVNKGNYYFDINSSDLFHEYKVKGLLYNSQIFISRSHGGYTYNSRTSYIVLYDYDTQRIESYLYGKGNPTDDEALVDSEGKKTIDLSKLKLAIFGACYTGYKDHDFVNLPDAAVICGAETAIGFKDTVRCDYMNSWFEIFFELLIEGKTVKESCELAPIRLYIKKKIIINDFKEKSFDEQKKIVSEKKNFKDFYKYYIAGNENLTLKDINTK